MKYLLVLCLLGVLCTACDVDVDYKSADGGKAEGWLVASRKEGSKDMDMESAQHLVKAMKAHVGSYLTTDTTSESTEQDHELPFVPIDSLDFQEVKVLNQDSGTVYLYGTATKPGTNFKWYFISGCEWQGNELFLNPAANLLVSKQLSSCPAPEILWKEGEVEDFKPLPEKCQQDIWKRMHNFTIKMSIGS